MLVVYRYTLPPNGRPIRRIDSRFNRPGITLLFIRFVVNDDSCEVHAQNPPLSPSLQRWITGGQPRSAADFSASLRLVEATVRDLHEFVADFPWATVQGRTPIRGTIRAIDASFPCARVLYLFFTSIDDARAIGCNRTSCVRGRRGRAVAPLHHSCAAVLLLGSSCRTPLRPSLDSPACRLGGSGGVAALLCCRCGAASLAVLSPPCVPAVRPCCCLSPPVALP